MKKISIIFIILCIIGCAGTKGKKQTVKDSRNKSEISAYSQHWNTGEDSLNLFLHMRLPLRQFVFRKSFDHFFSNITYTLVISHAEKNVQVYRESWNEKVIQPYYEDTRNPDNYFTTERHITLIPGHYKLFLNVQDEDSRQSWQLNKEYELERVGVLGPALLFFNNAESQKTLAVNIMEKIDTLWIRTQVNLQEERIIRIIGESDDKFKIDTDIQYTIRRKETIIDSGMVNVSGMGINHLYYLPIPIIQNKRGWYEITLSCQGENQTASFRYGAKGKKYWTDDVDEVVGVLQYILPYSEYKKLKNMDESFQWDNIHEYWKEKDPTPKTDENELISQLNNRVRYVNKNFSILMQGWRSDRGRIYIIYGPPHYVDESYQDQMGYTYQKWVYSSGKQFIFIDRSLSGDYSLYREIY
jgi:GWxTD domain-containing protein